MLPHSKLQKYISLSSRDSSQIILDFSKTFLYPYLSNPDIVQSFARNSPLDHFRTLEIYLRYLSQNSNLDNSVYIPRYQHFYHHG